MLYCTCNDKFRFEWLLTRLWDKIDKVIPLGTNKLIDQINDAIPELVAKANSTESPIYIADCSTKVGFTTAMLRDGVHPNAAGDKVMAQQIGPILVQLIKDKLAGK